MLESDLGATGQLLARLRSGVTGTDAEPALLEVATLVELFEMDKACELIDSLKSKTSNRH